LEKPLQRLNKLRAAHLCFTLIGAFGCLRSTAIAASIDEITVFEDGKGALLFLTNQSSLVKQMSGGWPFKTMMVISCEGQDKERSLSWESPTDGTGAWTRVELLLETPFIGRTKDGGRSEFKDAILPQAKPEQINEFLQLAASLSDQVCAKLKVKDN
jgi:hypothetical protein